MRNINGARRARFVALLMAALLVVAAAPALAARGGNGNGNGNKGKADPTLSVESAAAATVLARDGSMPNGEMIISGDGYVKETAILVKFYPMDTGYLTDADGTSFAFNWTPPGPGEYTLVSWQVTKRGQWEVAAETTFTVSE